MLLCAYGVATGILQKRRYQNCQGEYDRNEIQNVRDAGGKFDEVRKDGEKDYVGRCEGSNSRERAIFRCEALGRIEAASRCGPQRMKLFFCGVFADVGDGTDVSAMIQLLSESANGQRKRQLSLNIMS